MGGGNRHINTLAKANAIISQEFSSNAGGDIPGLGQKSEGMFLRQQSASGMSSFTQENTRHAQHATEGMGLTNQ